MKNLMIILTAVLFISSPALAGSEERLIGEAVDIVNGDQVFAVGDDLYIYAPLTRLEQTMVDGAPQVTVYKHAVNIEVTRVEHDMENIGSCYKTRYQGLGYGIWCHGWPGTAGYKETHSSPFEG